MLSPPETATRPVRVLIFVNCYIPGYKGGGPIRSIENLVGVLGQKFHFRIVAADRDYGDTSPYAGVPNHQWVTVGHSEVFYLKPGLRGLAAMLRLLRRREHDLLYLNSAFHPYFTIAPLLFLRSRLVPKTPVVLASRGELSAEALRIKMLKKGLFRHLINFVFKIYSGVVWQASTAYEELEIREFLHDSPVVRKVPVLVARDVVNNRLTGDPPAKRSKPPGKLDLVFVSRIAKKKNLLFGIKALRHIQGEATLRIYGPIEDTKYWADCQAEIATLPGNVKVIYGGVIEHADVPSVMNASHVFLLPTLNENFGHVVFEALSQGCVAVISDATAWRNLADVGAGWDIPLDQPDRYETALQQCMDMDDQVFQAASKRAVYLAEASSQDVEAVRQNEKLFNEVTSTGGGGVRHVT